MRCFTAIEGLNPENDDWKPAINPSSILLHGLIHKTAMKDYRAYSPPMHEGYALFIEEGRHDTSLGPEFIISVFMQTVIRALYNRNLELVLDAVKWDSAFWASCCCFVSWRFRGKSALPIAVAKIPILILWYYFRNDMELDLSGSALVLVIVNLGVSYSTLLCQLAKYSIKIDWKEVRSISW